MKVNIGRRSVNSAQLRTHRPDFAQADPRKKALAMFWRSGGAGYSYFQANSRCTKNGINLTRFGTTRGHKTHISSFPKVKLF